MIEAACDLLGLPWPPLLSLAEANLSPQALAFYAENRRVANGKAKRLLGWAPRLPRFPRGPARSQPPSRARSAMTSPASTSATPAAAGRLHA